MRFPVSLPQEPKAVEDVRIFESFGVPLDFPRRYAEDRTRWDEYAVLEAERLENGALHAG